MDDRKVGNFDFSKLNGDIEKNKDEEVNASNLNDEKKVENTLIINEEEEVNPNFMGGLSGGNKIASMNRGKKSNNKFHGGLIKNTPRGNSSNPFNISKLGGISG